ncbi:hypothetical protein VPH35_138682 [Triticum aestivum]
MPPPPPPLSPSLLAASSPPPPPPPPPPPLPSHRLARPDHALWTRRPQLGMQARGTRRFSFHGSARTRAEAEERGFDPGSTGGVEQQPRTPADGPVLLCASSHVPSAAASSSSDCCRMVETA